jgi:holin-like protein
MKAGTLIGLLALLLCWLTGEAIVTLLGLPVPGAVAGMLLLLAIALWRRRISAQTVEAGSGLLSHMALLFVPAGVGLVDQSTLIAQHGLAMMATLVLSAIVTLSVTALTLQWLLQRKMNRP